MINIKDILFELGKKAVEVSTEKLDKKSNLYKSIGYRISINGEVVELAVEANDYFKYVDQGRRAGKFPPVDKIEDWLKRNGQDISAAFPIARSIAEEGTKGKFISDDLVKQTDLSFTSFLNDNISEQIEEELNKIFSGKQ